jgi:hypothetical protein
MVVMATITEAQEPELFRHAKFQLQLRRWAEARCLLLQLATASPHDNSYRALLAYARGHEAAVARDLDRASTEWRRALTLDPKLDDAAAALRSRTRRKSIIDRLFGR